MLWVYYLKFIEYVPSTEIGKDIGSLALSQKLQQRASEPPTYFHFVSTILCDSNWGSNHIELLSPISMTKMGTE